MCGDISYLCDFFPLDYHKAQIDYVKKKNLEMSRNGIPR